MMSGYTLTDYVILIENVKKLCTKTRKIILETYVKSESYLMYLKRCSLSMRFCCNAVKVCVKSHIKNIQLFNYLIIYIQSRNV